MTAHIAWLSARHTQVAVHMHAGEFENDGIENEVAAITVTNHDGDGNGICIEGPPDDMLDLARRIQVAAFDIAQAIAADPELRALYGDTSPEPSELHEEMGRQSLDNHHFEPPFNDWPDEHDDRL